jgi:hypothetical protein
MKCAAAARNVLRATAFLVKQGCSACSRLHLLPDTTEGKTQREDVLFRSFAFKQVRDGTDVPNDDSGLFEPAATSPAGSPTTSRQVSFRGAVGTADTMVSARHSRLCAHALANAGASAKCNEAAVAQAAMPGIGAVLDEAADHSFKAWAIFEGEMLSKSWNGMLETIMTGKTAAQLLGLDNSFDLMSRTPKNVRIFNAAMVDLTRLVTPEILLAYNFGRISLLMDVGGGSGELIAAVVKEYPGLRGTVFDLPRCAETANDHLQKRGRQ